MWEGGTLVKAGKGTVFQKHLYLVAVLAWYVVLARLEGRDVMDFRNCSAERTVNV